MSTEFMFLSNTIGEIFSSTYLEKMARETGFIQREGKLKAKDFISLCTFLNDQSGEKSLNQLCSTLDSNRNVNLSAEGLNQRFNDSAVTFLKRIFTDTLSKKLLDHSGFTHRFRHYFNRIRILDSTGFGLPDSCSELYKGSTGAGLKAQLEYDLVSGEFLTVKIQDGIESDKKFGFSQVDTLKPKDLCLRDLGYFSYKDLGEIDARRASYISRLNVKSAVYRKKDPGDKYSGFIKINLEEIMEGMRFGDMLELDEVYVGSHYKLPTRLIICKLTEEQTKKRLILQKKKASRKGVTYSRQFKKLSALNLYVTNIPVVHASKQEIHELYTLRWQIEILFKTWKSLFGIQRVKKMKPERFECHLYGILLSLLISSMIVFQIRFVLFQKKKKEASEYKGMGIVKEYLIKLQYAIFDQPSIIVNVIESIYKMIAKNGKKSHRYKKLTVLDILGLTYGKNPKNAA
jgi:hypothetical protein